MQGGYEHYMQKEIHEQPEAVQQTMRGRVAIAKTKQVLYCLQDVSFTCLSLFECLQVAQALTEPCCDAYEHPMSYVVIAKHASLDKTVLPPAVVVISSGTDLFVL